MEAALCSVGASGKDWGMLRAAFLKAFQWTCPCGLRLILHIQINDVAECSAVFLRTQEVPGSNLRSEPGYPE
jgi:hypothetical protein